MADSDPTRGPVHAVRAAVAWAQQTRPARVFSHYLASGGPVLSGGMSYSSLFASFAGLWMLFSLVGYLLLSSPAVWDAVVAYLSKTIPGLIDTGSGGAVSVETLQSLPGTLTWTAAIAFVSLIFTLLGWLNAVRTGVRAQFGRSPLPQKPVIGQLKDLVVLVAFGLLVLISALASAGGTQLGYKIAGLLGFGTQSVVAQSLITLGFLLVSVALDIVILLIILRVLARVVIPLRQMFPTVIGGAITTTVLKASGTALIGGSANPLFTGFLTIIGLLLWFNLLSQAILLTAAWLAVVISDRHEYRIEHAAAAQYPASLSQEHPEHENEASPTPVHVPDSAIETAPHESSDAS